MKPLDVMHQAMSARVQMAMHQRTPEAARQYPTDTRALAKVALAALRDAGWVLVSS